MMRKLSVKKILLLFRKETFLNDILKVVSGTTIAQIVGIAIIPILTRLYAPDAFGLLAIFMSIAAIVGVISSLRYDIAIVLPESDVDAVNLLAVSLMSVVMISITSLIISIWVGDYFLGLIDASQMADYIWLISPMILATGAFNALKYWNSRRKRFERLSIARITSTIISQGGKLVAGITGYAYSLSLISFTVIGQFAAATILAANFWYDRGSSLAKDISLAKMKTVIRRYRRFPQFSIWSVLLNTISLELPTLLLAFFFSPITIGYYAIGYRLLKLPSQLVGSAISTVFYQRAAAYESTSSLAALIENVFERLVTFSLYPFLVFALAGRELFTLILGSEWAEAGVFVQILSPWIFITFVGSPLGTLFNVFEKQLENLQFNIAFIILRSLSLVVGGIAGNARLSLILFSSSGVIIWIWLIFWLLRLGNVEVTRVVKIFLLGLWKASLPILSLGMIMLIWNPAPWQFVCAVAVSTAVYYLLVLREDKALLSLISCTGSKEIERVS